MRVWGKLVKCALLNPRLSSILTRNTSFTSVPGASAVCHVGDFSLWGPV